MIDTGPAWSGLPVHPCYGCEQIGCTLSLPRAPVALGLVLFGGLTQSNTWEASSYSQSSVLNFHPVSDVTQTLGLYSEGFSCQVVIINSL